jgi:hypothetical protein
MDIAPHTNAAVGDRLAVAGTNPDPRTRLIEGGIVATATQGRLRVLVAGAAGRAPRGRALPGAGSVDAGGIGATDTATAILHGVLRRGRPGGAMRLADAPTVDVPSPGNATRGTTRRRLGDVRMDSAPLRAVREPSDRSGGHRRSGGAGETEVIPRDSGVLVPDPPALTLDISRVFH